jgi:hypothetical protein
MLRFSGVRSAHHDTYFVVWDPRLGLTLFHTFVDVHGFKARHRGDSRWCVHARRWRGGRKEIIFSNLHKNIY